MANVDHIKVGSTSYDISPSPTGTLTTGTGGFSSSDAAQANATAWTAVNQITTSDTHASIFTKITQMVKNVRYLYNVLGTGFSTSSTVKNQIDGKAASSHSHTAAQLPTSSTQVNSNDYIPTSALIYSMNQTLTSLNDACLKKSGGTMTGDISFTGIGDTEKSKGLYWSGSTDGASIYYQTLVSDQGNLVINLTDDDNCYLRIAKNGVFTESYFTPDGAFHGKCYGAVYNDYAEFFPRGEETEPGDIIALDLSSDKESYIKATNKNSIIAGVHSDEYAMLIGGEAVKNNEDYIKSNIKKYIPVALCGRVHCKCIGVIHKGDIIVVSNIPGIGRAKSPNENIEFIQIVGYAVDEDLDTSIRQVRIRVRG